MASFFHRNSSPASLLRNHPAKRKPVVGSPTTPSSATPSPETALTWTGPSYPHIPAGRYSAVGVRALGPQWLKRYRRWSLLIEFRLLAEPVQIACFYNLGENPDECQIKRGSNYFRDWTIAVGGLPEKGQAMTPEAFLAGQVYLVEVVDSKSESKERTKSDEEMYSRIKQILRVDFRP